MPGSGRRRRDTLARGVLAVASVGVMVAAYAAMAYTVDDREMLPPPGAIADAAASLLTGHPSEAGGHTHHTGHVAHVVSQAVTLQGSLALTVLRVMFGLVVGGVLGVLTGFAMGWSRRVDDYVHPVFVLLRSVPPLALIAYVMLWFGHGEAHRLIPIVYAVFTAVVIPTYHGVRDVAEVYVRAARSLGARRALLLGRVVLPVASPFVLSALRYGLVIAWMTAVGVEMLMGENGIGHLIVGGGLWSSRLEIGVDPAVVIVAILGLATTAWAMDLAARLLTARLTAWSRTART